MLPDWLTSLLMFLGTIFAAIFEVITILIEIIVKAL